jgi:hypothetical protein
MRPWIFGVLTASALAAPGAALAVSGAALAVPAASVSGSWLTDLIDKDSNGHYYEHEAGGSFSGAGESSNSDAGMLASFGRSASIAFTSRPGIHFVTTTSSTDKNGPVAKAISYAEMTYYFRISGPDGTVPVNFNVVGGFDGSGVGGAGSHKMEAYAYVDGPNGLALGEYYRKGFSGVVQASTNVVISGAGAKTSFSDQSIHFLSANYDYRVRLSALNWSFVAGNLGGGGANLDVFVDPIFTIQPGYENYALTFSEGIGNSVASVPEPANWALMIAGFGLTGGAMRRRGALTA